MLRSRKYWKGWSRCRKFWKGRSRCRSRTFWKRRSATICLRFRKPCFVALKWFESCLCPNSPKIAFWTLLPGDLRTSGFRASPMHRICRFVLKPCLVGYFLCSNSVVHLSVPPRGYFFAMLTMFREYHLASSTSSCYFFCEWSDVQISKVSKY